MQSALYDAVAFGMRYWFLILIALMLFTLIAVSVAEYRRHKSIMNTVGRYIGYMEITGGDEASLGMRLGLTNQTLIGSSRRADIVIEDDAVERSHAVISQRGEDIIISPVADAEYGVNGQTLNRPCRIHSGDTLSFGSVDAVVFFKEEEVNDA